MDAVRSRFSVPVSGYRRAADGAEARFAACAREDGAACRATPGSRSGQFSDVHSSPTWKS
ncbi:hypothetical protein caldi_11060 [Caldinitratiruptor microaerophilus]|uniref:Uncharacterized protein n=1 Tax=Caldinitratiruptor microaerophilus TaxID=671077 RepID=A0AA35G5S2_9FIRM|nr:hypothetical protein caldi_11060 [Caldinitratiruptor microaerophilus]